MVRLAPENLAAIRGLAEIQHRRGDAPADRYPDPEPEPPPAAATPEPPRSAAPIGDTRALAGLEALLAAILRARAAPADAAR